MRNPENCLRELEISRRKGWGPADPRRQALVFPAPFPLPPEPLEAPLQENLSQSEAEVTWPVSSFTSGCHRVAPAVAMGKGKGLGHDAGEQEPSMWAQR